VKIARFIMAGGHMGIGIPKHVFAGMMECLPDDTKVLGFGQDISNNASFMLVTSERFAEVAEGARMPDLDVTFKVEERKTERTVVSISVGSEFLRALEVKTETIKDEEVDANLLNTL